MGCTGHIGRSSGFVSGIDLHGKSCLASPANRRNHNAAKLNMVARKKSFTELAAEYSTLAFVLPAATFVGWLLGHLLDKAFGTGYLNIVGLMLGIVAGFVQLIRQVMRDTHDTDG
ncbi:MAG TPA: AtpZ/AtpI family protein [Bryobacteraceae bacterium]